MEGTRVPFSTLNLAALRVVLTLLPAAAQLRQSSVDGAELSASRLRLGVYCDRAMGWEACCPGGALTSDLTCGNFRERGS